MKRLLSLLLAFPLSLAALTQQSSQAVVSISENWNSSHANLYLYEKKGTAWVPVSGPHRVRLGKSGSAWGRGIHPNPKGARLKREGDRRTPAGIFHIGGAWGYAKAIKKNPRLAYRQVTSRDLWVEDPRSSYYNQHLVIGHEPRASWEKKAQMKQGDHAHSLKLFVAHNPPPNAVPNAGSAVFFHIWRGGGSKATFGCTTMPEAKLKNMISWINPDKRPIYIVLPKAEYEKRRHDWKLP